jgi:capsular exopolysaccharide synthesis family protein
LAARVLADVAALNMGVVQLIFCDKKDGFLHSMIQESTATATPIPEASPAPTSCVAAPTVRHELSEYYAALLRRLRSVGGGAAVLPHVIGVTSCQRHEGVSTVAANLAITAARIHNRPTLLIDANTFCPSVAGNFDIGPATGFSDLLRGRADLADCIQPTVVEHLSAITAGDVEGGTLSVDPSAVRRMLEQLKRQFEFVVVDLPEANELTTCFTLAGVLDGLLLVVESEQVSREMAARVKQQLLEAHAILLGAVFNKH